MDKDDKSELWRVLWTWSAVIIGAGAGVLFTERLIDGVVATALAGIVTTIIAGTWIKRPGDTAGAK